MMKNDDISELNFLDSIDELEVQYNRVHTDSVVNVSNWNPSQEFKAELAHLLSLDNSVDCIDYLFSYTQTDDRKKSVFSKLGIKTEKSILFTHSGSSSILNCVNLLYIKGIRKIVALCPAYFTLFYSCKLLGIECVPLYLERDKDGYTIDSRKILNERTKDVAFWVTNPVYCTSVYYNPSTINLFKTILDTNIVVFDESLCSTSKELSHLLYQYDNYIGIYSPHKSICMNGNKFSVLISKSSDQKVLDAWSDVLCGCLSSGNDIAISHYLSNNFLRYNEAFIQNILDNKRRFESICKDNSVDYDKRSYGYLVSAYFPHINATKGTDINFITKIINQTGVRFISGKRNHFGDDLGFSFRINLAAYNEHFHYALCRLLNYLSEFK